MTGSIRRRSCFTATVFLLAVALFCNRAAAQTVQQFYRGKTLTIVVGSGAGGGDDVFARLLARYLPKYLPGAPTVVIQNQPGAGGLIAAAQIANSSPRDGTFIGAVMRTVPMAPLLSDQPVNFDPMKMNWLGSLASETNTIVVWHTSRAMTFDDLFTRETVVGTAGGSSDTNVYALLLKKTLGAKLKIVGGYQGGPEIDLAMQRGEVEGRVSITWTSLKGTRAEWLSNHQVRVLAQMGLERNPELPDVPNVLEYVQDPQVRSIYEFLFSRQKAGRPFVAPPETPRDRVEALRNALADVAADKGFRAEAEKTGANIDLVTGEALQKMVERYFAMTPDAIGATRAALSGQ